MNRPIEFRAWSKTYNKFIDLNVITEQIVTSNPWCKMTSPGVFIPLEDHIVLQQFTGLFDKKEKRIFDGDIVIATKDSGAKIRKGETYYIYFNQKMGHYGMIKKSSYHDVISYNLDLYYEGYDTAQLSRPKSSAIEVVGNIFENLDLLK